MPQPWHATHGTIDPLSALLLILRRSLLLLGTLLAISWLTFAIVNALPGDLAHAILGDAATPEQIAVLRHQLGLDLPFGQRYVAWLTSLLHGDLGVSRQYGQPIAAMLWGRLQNSLILGVLALLVATPLAIALGVAAAVYRDSWIDRLVAACSLVSFGVPEYVVGVAAILIFGIWLPWLPASSLLAAGENPFARPEALVLPVAVLALGLLTYTCQITRAGMVTALRSGYVRTAVLKGMSRKHVILRHALPNALLPVICEVGMHFGYVIGGLVVVETLFAYAGIGQMMVSAVNYRDVATVQATILVIASAYGIGNLLADVATILLDPRIGKRA